MRGGLGTSRRGPAWLEDIPVENRDSALQAAKKISALLRTRRNRGANTRMERCEDLALRSDRAPLVRALESWHKADLRGTVARNQTREISHYTAYCMCGNNGGRNVSSTQAAVLASDADIDR